MFAVLATAAKYELKLRAERQAEGIAAAERREADGAMLPGKKRWAAPPSSTLPLDPGPRCVIAAPGLGVGVRDALVELVFRAGDLRD